MIFAEGTLQVYLEQAQRLEENVGGLWDTTSDWGRYSNRYCGKLLLCDGSVRAHTYPALLAVKSKECAMSAKPLKSSLDLCRFKVHLYWWIEQHEQRWRI